MRKNEEKKEYKYIVCFVKKQVNDIFDLLIYDSVDIVEKKDNCDSIIISSLLSDDFLYKEYFSKKSIHILKEFKETNNETSLLYNKNEKTMYILECDGKLKQKIFEEEKEILPDYLKVKEELMINTVGQDKHIKEIVTAAYTHYKLGLKKQMLIASPTGVGKTYIAKQLAIALEVPFVVEDATKYTVSGYVGNSVNNMLINLYYAAKCDLERAQKGILIIDEIDKLSNSDPEQEFRCKGVLMSLLTLIEGSIVNLELDKNNVIEFDTSNLLVITLGAFSDLRESKQTINMGFNNSNLDSSYREQKLTRDNLIKHGMPQEFLGRINVLIQLNELTKDNFLEIIKNPFISPLQKYYNIFNDVGIKMEIDDIVITKIIETTYEYGLGARGLVSVIDHIFLSVISQYFENSDNFYNKLIITDLINNEFIYNFYSSTDLSRLRK